jgi:hypothetical protein
MNLLGKPVFAFLKDLYDSPLSSERWSPPEWQPKGHQCPCAVLGELSPEAWRITGVMRDANAILVKRVAEHPNPQAAREKVIAIFGAVSYSISKMLDAQVRADLIASGVSPDDATFIKIEQGGGIRACEGMRLGGSLLGILEFDSPRRQAVEV